MGQFSHNVMVMGNTLRYLWANGALRFDGEACGNVPLHRYSGDLRRFESNAITAS